MIRVLRWKMFGRLRGGSSALGNLSETLSNECRHEQFSLDIHC